MFMISVLFNLVVYTINMEDGAIKKYTKNKTKHAHSITVLSEGLH